MADENEVFEGPPGTEARYRFQLEQAVMGKSVKGVTYQQGQDEASGMATTTFTFHFEDGSDVGLQVTGPAKVTVIISTPIFHEPESKRLQ